MGRYSIKDLEILTGIKAHTLRIWEQRYAIIEPLRTDTNIRYYNDDQLKKLLNLSVLYNSGWKISKLAALSEQELAKKLIESDKNESSAEKGINSLIEGMVDLNKEKINKVLHQEKDILVLFETIVFPFLQKVGFLWTSKSINPGQEHFASNIIKRFLVQAIEELPEPNKEASHFVLFLMEGEWHEITLLLSEYQLKRAGKRVMYLGASVPLDDISKILEITDVDYFLCVSILAQPLGQFQMLLNKICSLSDENQFLFAGKSFYNKDLSLPKNAIILSSFRDLNNF